MKIRVILTIVVITLLGFLWVRAHKMNTIIMVSAPVFFTSIDSGWGSLYLDFELFSQGQVADIEFIDEPYEVATEQMEEDKYQAPPSLGRSLIGFWSIDYEAPLYASIEIPYWFITLALIGLLFSGAIRRLFLRYNSPENH